MGAMSINKDSLYENMIIFIPLGEVWEWGNQTHASYTPMECNATKFNNETKLT